MLNENTDAIDAINDILTTYCDDQFDNQTEVVSYVERADATLRLHALKLDSADIEAFAASDDDARGEAVSTTFPIYGTNDEQTEYDLVVTYTFDEDDGRFIIDMEMLYSFELEGFEYDEDEEE